MQMTIVTKATRLARTIAIGALALGAVTIALPTAAEASSKTEGVSKRLDQIASQVENVRDIDNRKRQGKVIDALQKKLYRLDRVSDNQRGRRARVNDARIDRLQSQLDRMERRIASRDYRRDDRRDYRRDDRRDYRRDDRRDDRRWDHQEDPWNSEWSRQTYSK